jgi:nucleotide-binding universal stress UspA family protein
MSLKDVLVYVGSDPACASRVEVAVALAAAHDAHLTGLHVMAWPAIPGYVAAELPPQIHEVQRGQLREAATEAEALFGKMARRDGLRAEWRAGEGNVLATVTLHARYADLTVVGQGVDVGEAPMEVAFLPEDLVLAVGRPVLVVPRYGTFRTVGERVLVAWNASREATRAVNDAIPILQRAAKVTVLSVDPGDRTDRRVPGADIALHLARHGINAEAAQTPGANIGIGDVLLSYASDRGADLIVMGAYGHSRIREMVLGGTTRHLLQHMTVPVLMSH